MQGALCQKFVDCCDTILPFFDHLGPVFYVARGEFQQKLESLKTQSLEKPLLVDIVEADRRANRATVKNSATRNLHRLSAAILFVKLLFERLLSSAQAAAAEAAAAAAAEKGVGAGAGATAAGSAADAAAAAAVVAESHTTLREAASCAYETALAPFHTGIVKVGFVFRGLQQQGGVVRAGMLTLPSKEHFIASIGESEETAAERARDVVAACEEVHSSVSRLFDGIAMPASSVWLWPR
ncbi:hypothetical protein COO60DRAFT_1698177 [Scenedesmus sp. NREL 46B-D3]|nr:hypothetical protein COO60DRAFT_1698177 [Scenedesmus sp. NREL 46B-D3]